MSVTRKNLHHLQEILNICVSPNGFIFISPLQFSSPALALYTLVCFSEAEVNVARLLLLPQNMVAWL